MNYSTLTNNVSNEVALLLVVSAFGVALTIAAFLERARVRKAEQRGRARGRSEAVDYLRGRAVVHQGQVGDARRRSALNRAADDIRDGRLTAVSR